jgi:hypothetical protein
LDPQAATQMIETVESARRKVRKLKSMIPRGKQERFLTVTPHQQCGDGNPLEIPARFDAVGKCRGNCIAASASIVRRTIV